MDPTQQVLGLIATLIAVLPCILAAYLLLGYLFLRRAAR